MRAFSKTFFDCHVDASKADGKLAMSVSFSFAKSRMLLIRQCAQWLVLGLPRCLGTYLGTYSTVNGSGPGTASTELQPVL